MRVKEILVVPKIIDQSEINAWKADTKEGWYRVIEERENEYVIEVLDTVITLWEYYMTNK